MCVKSGCTKRLCFVLIGRKKCFFDLEVDIYREVEVLVGRQRSFLPGGRMWSGDGNVSAGR